MSGRVVVDTEICRAVESNTRGDLQLDGLQIALGRGAQRFHLRAPRHGSKSKVVVASARKGETMTPPGLEF